MKKEEARKAELARQEELAAQAAAEKAAELERQAEAARKEEEAKKKVSLIIFHNKRNDEVKPFGLFRFSHFLNYKLALNICNAYCLWQIQKLEKFFCSVILYQELQVACQLRIRNINAFRCLNGYITFTYFFVCNENKSNIEFYAKIVQINQQWHQLF